jgi:hypothetical protein
MSQLFAVALIFPIPSRELFMGVFVLQAASIVLDALQ